MIKQLIQKIFGKNDVGVIQKNEYTFEPIRKYEFNRKEVVEQIKKFSVSVLLGESRVVDKIVIHCSGCKSDEILNIDDAESFFKEKYGKKIIYTNSYIPFHFLITNNGYIASTMPLNAPYISSSAIGICYIGGVNEYGELEDTRTTEQKNSIAWLVSNLRSLLGINKVSGCIEYNENK